MEHNAFYHASMAVAFGMAAQTLATRLGIPSILFLLATGLAVGPDGFGLLNPAVFGSARTDLVTLAVSVILFEGGLALKLDTLRSQQRSLVLLLTVGAAISMLVGALAAHFILAMPWPLALLFGALVIVTGPTVVTPLLSRLSLDRTVRELLIGEGVLIDPVGAIVAIVTAEYVVGHSILLEATGMVVVRLGVGALAGGLAGATLGGILRREWIPDGLRNPAILGAVLLSSAMANRLSSEAGLMASVVQGMVMANAGIRDLGLLRQFKEELTVLLLSFIFVVLAASLSVDAVVSLGWKAPAVAAVVAWVGRPLAVLVCTAGSGLTVGQRLFVSWICPRGIVAAAVAALFAILLDNAGIAGGEQLEALVFVTVAFTVTVQGVSAGPVARLLGVDLATLKGTIIVGADHFGRLVARLLIAYGRQVALIDKNPQFCAAARAERLPVFRGDALARECLEEAGVRYADTFLAVTRNPELNALATQQVRRNFRVERVLSASAGAVADEGPTPFPGNFVLDEANYRLRLGHARVMEYEVMPGDWVGRELGDLPYGGGEFALLLVRRDRPFVADSRQTLAAADRLVCLERSEAGSPLAASLAPRRTASLRELEAVFSAAPRGQLQCNREEGESTDPRTR